MQSNFLFYSINFIFSFSASAFNEAQIFSEITTQIFVNLKTSQNNFYNIHQKIEQIQISINLHKKFYFLHLQICLNSVAIHSRKKTVFGLSDDTNELYFMIGKMHVIFMLNFDLIYFANIFEFLSENDSNVPPNPCLVISYLNNYAIIGIY
jgi:hypothetical protein